MLLAPSFNSLLVTGLLLLSILIIFLTNFRKFVSLEFYKKISLLSLLIIAIGVHGLIYMGLEINYGFNPFNL
jgi:ABC-type lipoprotein release transport system permease subunit